MEVFSTRFGCKITAIEDGEHWFHTPEELSILCQWETESLESLKKSQKQEFFKY